MTKWKKFAVWGGANGLVLAIAIANGIDISKEGIVEIVIQGIFSGILGIMLSIFLFLCATYSSYLEIKELTEQETTIIILTLSCFSFILLIYLGTAWNNTLIEKIGIVPLLISIFLIIYESNYN